MNDDLIARAEAALEEVDSGYRSAAYPLRGLLSDLIARVKELEEALRAIQKEAEGNYRGSYSVGVMNGIARAALREDEG